MSGQATLVALEDAEAGMVLAADLKDAGGAVLLPAGTALSEASLKSLARRGVEQVSVVADEPAETDEQKEAERLRQLGRLERLFRHSAASGATGRLLGYLQRYRKEG
jgi:hypothetical protein